MSSELILDALLAATAVISVAWLAAVAARRAPAALRNTLWRMALVGFWVAPAIVIATHAGPWQPHTIAVPLLPAAQEVAQPIPPGSDLSATAASLSSTSTIPRAPTAPERTPPPRHIPPVSLLLLLWAAGAALGMIYLIKDLRAVRRLILATRPLDDPALQQRVTALAAQLGLRTSPAVAASSAISTPTVAGQGVPVLLLPEDFSSAPGSDDAVIVHELAHIRRGDLLLYSAARLTRALWWWHPLAWLMARELVLSAEEACDDWAVALTGQRTDYATTLVDWAEAATAVAGLPCAPRGRALVKRVRHILQSTQVPRLHLSWQARTILAVCAMGMVVLVGTVHLRAVPADEIMLAQAGETAAQPQSGHAVTVQGKVLGPDELPNDKWMREDIEQMLAEMVTADAEFNLDFHLATRVEDPTEEVPPGYQIIERERLCLMARTEPDLVFTEKDIRTILLMQGRSHGEEGEAIPGDSYFGLGLAKNAAQAFAQFTGQNIGQIIAIKLNGEVVATPVIKARMGGAFMLPRSDMPEEHQKILLAFSGQPPEIVPGTGKIVVKARFGDGARPLGAECLIQTYSQAQPRPRKPGSTDEYLIPEVVGAYGDWIIYNVGEGPWSVTVGGNSFAGISDVNTRQPIEVNPGEERVVQFTLLRGGSVSGRVVYADTGQPASGVWVDQPSRRCGSTTDSEGRYTVRHLAPGPTGFIMARAEDYVPGRSGDVQVEDEGAVTAPDIRLRRGGWISGYIVGPKEAAQRDRLGGSVMPRFEGERPLGAVISSERLSEDGELRFRLGPVPPGLYTVEANLSRGKLSTERWAGEVKGVQVNVGEDTSDVVIEVTRANG